MLTPRDFAPGIHHDISHADYLAIPALSSTSLKRLIRSAAHYRYALDNPDADDQTVDEPREEAGQQVTWMHRGGCAVSARGGVVLAIGHGVNLLPIGQQYLA